MSNLQLTQTKTDILGATASVLCLIHCLATPYLFIAGAGAAANQEEGPAWWGMIDLALLVVSLFSAYWSAKKSSKQWMKYALYATWLVLAFLIFNEKFEGIRLPAFAAHTS
ncbi:MerC domain-containing protein [Dyadobacter crusticola]|uniref:MerC domain-containing protein n=1 Tax=Dyadobacter crusticola TaxID=292407 RepID=UPI000A0102FA